MKKPKFEFTTSVLTQRIAEMPLVELGDECARMESADLDLVARDLEGIAAHCALRAAYLAMRHGCGCGDQGHKSAVKDANKVYRQVRKALGYNITHPINF